MIEAGGFVPSLATRSGSCGCTSEPSAWADSNSAGSTGSVLDFTDLCCIAQHLIIELDGSQHAEPEEERKDALRTAYLNQQGYQVMRFWNNQVNTELEGVLQAIYKTLTDS